MQQRGIALIISLFLSIVILMTLSAGYMLINGKSSATSQLQARSAAKDAAEAGYRYALTRLQDNAGWQGNATIQVNDPTNGMVVVEDAGNVLGFLTDRAGRISQFRIRFSYQNGGTPLNDGLGDPSPSHLINTQYLSVNNLLQTAPSPYPAVNPSTANEPVVGVQTSFVPSGCCSLTVIGLAGDGLQSTSPSSPTPNFGGPAPVVQQIERDLVSYGAGNTYDSSVYSGADLTASATGNFLVNSSKPTAAPRVRGMGNFTASAGTNYVSPNGWISLSSAGGTASGAPGVQVDHSTTGAIFPALSWSLMPSGGSSLNAGTYLVQSGGVTYYSVDSQTVPLTGGTTVTTWPTGMAFSGTNFTLSSAVNVVPSGSAHGLEILSDPSLLAAGLRPCVNMTGSGAALKSTDSAGSVYLQGNLMGTGSLWSAGNVEVQGTSVLQPNPNSKLAVYAKGDIVVDPVPPQVVQKLDIQYGAISLIINLVTGLLEPGPPNPGPQGQDVAFGGILFAQGNVTAALSPTNGGGNFSSTGIITAYGGNPDLQQPPGTNGGSVNITCADATVTFDPTYANQLYQSGNGGRLARISTAILTGN